MASSGQTSVGDTLFQIDRACDQFEKDWNEGREPRIEDVLATLPPKAAEQALRDLAGIEIELRRKRGERIRWVEYAERFPDHVSVIDELALASKGTVGSTLPARATDTQPGAAVTQTRFRDLRLFRRGGLGTLYRGTDDALHREAVVKFMNEQCEQDPNLIAQFKIEAEVTSRLDHPGIVPVFGIGEDWRGRPFYVMRLIHGRELKEAISEYHAAGGASGGPGSRQTLFALLEHLTSACNTVAYAHHVGIIHCDIKPSNIMIGKYGETFVLDWGLATNFERTSTFISPNEPTMRPHSAAGGSSSGQRGGTYGYISPEQLCTDGPIGPTSDVYSLGATLYEILTGQPPFDGRDPNVREQIRLGQFPPPRQLAPHTCPRLEAICLKALHLSPISRYATAKLLANDLTNWMRDEEIAAKPDRWYSRIGRFTRRHRGATATAIVALFAVLIAAGLTIRSIEIARTERLLREKEEQAQQAKNELAEAVDQGLTKALNTFEELSRPFANGEMNNLAIFKPLVESIKAYAAGSITEFEHNPAMKKHMARMFELRGTLCMYSEEMGQALDDLQRAHAIYERLRPASTVNLADDMRLAQNELGQGRLLIQLQKLDAARIILESAKARLQQMLKVESEDEALRRQLAEALHCLGEVDLTRRLVGPVREQALIQAEKNFDESKKIRDKLVKDTDGEESRNHLRDLARSLGYLGDLYLVQGNVPKAIEAYEESKKDRETLYRTRITDPEHRFQYARGLANFGRLVANYGGDVSAAIQQMGEAEAIQRNLAEDFPEVVSCASDWGSSLATLAELYLDAAQSDPAKADEYRKQAFDAAQQASKVYAGLTYQKNAFGPAGLAQSKLLMAIVQQETNPGAARRALHEADQLLTSLGPEGTLGGSDLVLRAIERSLKGEPEAALDSLRLAVERGENTIHRFEREANLGLKTLAENPQLGPQFKTLLRDVRATLTLN